MLVYLFAIAALGIATFALWELRIVTGYWKQARRRDSDAMLKGSITLSDRRTPSVTVQLPIYNEAAVVGQLIQHAAALDYPRDALHIQILDDSTDSTPEIVAAALAALPPERASLFSHVQRGSRDGFKAGALAHGMTLSSTEFYAIFDSDFLPPQGFLRRVLIEGTAFDDPEIAFVQGRWTFYNQDENLFARIQSILIDRHFLVQKPFQIAEGDDIMFNGSGGVWRRSAIETAGGWSGDTLCEDMDLTYRTVLGGQRGVYDIELECANELPADIVAFKLQQRRWAKGTAQNLVPSRAADCRVW